METSADVQAEAQACVSLVRELEGFGYSDIHLLPARGLCGIHKLMFTTGLVVGMDRYGYVGRYCYEHERDARAALAAWNGRDDPPGPWIKWKGEGGERLGPGATGDGNG